MAVDKRAADCQELWFVSSRTGVYRRPSPHLKPIPPTAKSSIWDYSHIDRRQGTVRDTTAHGTSKGEARVELQAGELLRLGDGADLAKLLGHYGSLN